tara:strand:+ start:209 stop:424 length:216 start_codon:yes stop_codon:yes gene_type:complete
MNIKWQVGWDQKLSMRKNCKIRIANAIDIREERANKFGVTAGETILPRGERGLKAKKGSWNRRGGGDGGKK